MNATAMYKALLFAQWKHQRNELIVFTMAGSIIAPAALWQAMNLPAEWDVMRLLTTSMVIGGLGSALAIATGFLLAVRPFVLDGRSQHTYALALPLPRVRYSLLRVATGLTLTILPALGFLVGALVASQAIPPTLLLRAYPVGLTLRFLLAAALAFAVGFGLQYGLGRRAARWMVIAAITIGAFELFGQLVLHVSLTSPFWELLAHPASPLRVFGVRWMLFDV